MKLFLSRCLALGLMCCPAVALCAQEGSGSITLQTLSNPQQGVTGFAVTGRMVCADTQRAARFAQVTLIPAAQGDGGFGGGRRMTARTDLDGNFTVVNVTPGDYYVTGSLPGYVNQTQLVQSALNVGGDPGTALAGVPTVHVSAGGAATALSLQRGGTLAGTVSWDDGTPAAGVSVSAQPATSNTATTQAPNVNGRILFGGFSGAQTDDRGRFRLSGLAPGSYYLRASVQAPTPQRPDDRTFIRTLTLAVYAPDKVRRTDATPIAVSAGEEHADISVVMGLAGMHTVSGVVSASASSVRSGTATLTDQTDSTLSRNGVIGSDGSFIIPYVPPGTYTLRIAASSQPPTFGRGGGGNTGDTIRFQPMQESVTVTDGDLSGLAITVTTATASQ